MHGPPSEISRAQQFRSGTAYGYALLTDWLSPTRTGRVRITGLLASLAAAVAIAADSDLIAYIEALRSSAATDTAALLAAHYAGTFAIPVMALGYWQVYWGLREATPRYATTILLSGTFATAIGGAIHALSSLALHGIPAGTPDLAAALQPYAPFIYPLWIASTAGVLLASLGFALAVFRHPTPYPRWAALTNPFVLIAATAIAFRAIPELSAWAVAAPNIGHLLFFLLSTKLLTGVQPAR